MPSDRAFSTIGETRPSAERTNFSHAISTQSSLQRKSTQHSRILCRRPSTRVRSPAVSAVSIPFSKSLYLPPESNRDSQAAVSNQVGACMHTQLRNSHALAQVLTSSRDLLLLALLARRSPERTRPAKGPHVRQRQGTKCSTSIRLSSCGLPGLPGLPCSPEARCEEGIGELQEAPGKVQ